MAPCDFWTAAFWLTAMNANHSKTRSRRRSRATPWALLCILACVLWASATWSAPCSTGSSDGIAETYDASLQLSARRWLPHWDWRWLKAQCYQESLLDPLAVSPAGARGLCQFMPRTWSEVQRAFGWRSVSPFHPAASAYASGWYMRRMRLVWKAERPEHDRRELAQASYNAGAGNIIDAQAECGRALGQLHCRHWPAISRSLPAITGHHAKETTTYVARISRWYRALTCSAG